MISIKIVFNAIERTSHSYSFAAADEKRACCISDSNKTNTKHENRKRNGRKKIVFNHSAFVTNNPLHAERTMNNGTSTDRKGIQIASITVNHFNTLIVYRCAQHAHTRTFCRCTTILPNERKSCTKYACSYNNNDHAEFTLLQMETVYAQPYITTYACNNINQKMEHRK